MTWPLRTTRRTLAQGSADRPSLVRSPHCRLPRGLSHPGPNGEDSIDRDDGTEYQPALTTDGVNPDASGYSIMTTMAEQAIQYFQVSGTKRTGNLITMNK
jgi:hypothetical protein